MENRIIQKMCIRGKVGIDKLNSMERYLKDCGFWFTQSDFKCELSHLLFICEAVDRLLNFCDPQFIHLQNVDKPFTHHEFVVTIFILIIRINFRNKYMCDGPYSPSHSG